MKRVLSFFLSLSMVGAAHAADITLPVDTAVVVPVNILPLTDDVDFKSRETGVAYNAAGMDLVWNFVTPAGVVSQTAVTPTTSGTHDWADAGTTDGIYTLEIPASGGTINNSAEGYGWFTGYATGILPWRGPVIEFVPANVVNSLVAGTDKLEVDTQQFGGANGTFSGGIPAVNTTLVSSSTTAATELAETFDNDGTGGDIDLSSLNVTGSTTYTGHVSLADGMAITCSTANRDALKLTGNGTGHGAYFTSGGGATGDGMRLESAATSGRGLTLTGSGGGNGMRITSGSGSTGAALQIVAASTKGNGITATGAGTGEGISATGGDTGEGMQLNGGASEGAGLKLASTADYGLDIISVSNHGVNILGDSLNVGNASGVYVATNSSNGDGITAVGLGTGADIRGDIAGNLSGSVGSVGGLTAGGIADAVLDELLSGHTTSGSLSKTISDIYGFLNGAPTFASAMNGQGYTTALASKLDTNVDAKISEVPLKTPSLLVSSTIDDTSVAVTQTSFALAAGPPDDDALNGAIVIVTRGTQKSIGLVKDYAQSTKTVTLVTDPGIFTFADGDKVDVIATGSPAALWLGGSP